MTGRRMLNLTGFVMKQSWLNRGTTIAAFVCVTEANHENKLIS
jgi:hypothetical protein